MLLINCAIFTPVKDVNFKIVNKVKLLNLKKMRTNAIIHNSPEINNVNIRSIKMISPFDMSYPKYLRYSLNEYLMQSNIWDPISEYVISGEMIKNKVNGDSIKLGYVLLEVKFEVEKQGEIIYSKIHKVKHDWKSSFIGAKAIPDAMNNYPIAIDKLIEDFLIKLNASKVLYKN